MSFSNPWLLALLAVLAALAWWHVRSLGPKQAAWTLPGNPAVWGGAASWRAALARWQSPLLKLAVAALLIAALAGPQKLVREPRGSGSGIDIMLAMDTSTSMSAVDLKPSRIAAAKAAALNFIKGRTGDRIGAVQFGGAPELVCPLTADYGALASQISMLYPGMTQSNGTAIGDGIVSAVNHLAPGKAKTKIIILLTDGSNNAGLVDPVTAAKTAQAEGIKIYTIGCGTRGQAYAPGPGGMMVPIADDLDEPLLTKIASMTGGRYFRATDSSDLHDIYATIDKLQKSKIKEPPIVSRTDYYEYPAAAAAALLVLEILFSNVLFLIWP